MKKKKEEERMCRRRKEAKKENQVKKIMKNMKRGGRENPNESLDDLYVKTAFADMAPNQHMRRWRPRAQGRATRIVKGMSHITVVVSDGEEN